MHARYVPGGTRDAVPFVIQESIVNAIRSVPTLTYAAAAQVVDAAIAAAEAEGVPVNVAVADPGGNLIVFARMDGAALMSGRIAQDKAYTVAAFNGLPTHRWYPMIADEPALLTGIVHTDRLVVFGGGMPIMVDDALAGAVGVSGGTAEQDVRISTAAAASVT